MKAPSILFACICLLWSCKLGAAELGGLEMQVRFSLSESGSDRTGVLFGYGRFRYDFFVMFKNVGNGLIVIPKAGCDPAFTSSNELDGVAYQMCFYWEIMDIEKNIPNIPPESELSLVRLQKGEATVLRFAIMNDQKFDEDHISVKYSVSHKFATRFGTWNGALVESPKK